MNFFKIAFLLLVLMLGCSSMEATNVQGTITLMNDSPYVLTATVYTHSGDFLGQLTLQPGQQSNFVSNLYSTYLNRPGNSEVSITPYRVVWQCAGGGVYSMCTDGSVGAFIRASTCPGQYFCQPKEESKKAPTDPLPKAQTKLK